MSVSSGGTRSAPKSECETPQTAARGGHRASLGAGAAQAREQEQPGCTAPSLTKKSAQ
jgi:hypothetical protein